jgi:hypothetical protein
MSSDPVRTREYYLLGAMHGAAPLSDALASLALGGGPARPGLPALDEEVIHPAGLGILLAANGYREGDEQVDVA